MRPAAATDPMPYWMIVLVMIVGIAAAMGLGALTSGNGSLRALLIVAVLGSLAVAALGHWRRWGRR